MESSTSEAMLMLIIKWLSLSVSLDGLALKKVNLAHQWRLDSSSGYVWSLDFRGYARHSSSIRHSYIIGVDNGSIQSI